MSGYWTAWGSARARSDPSADRAIAHREIFNSAAILKRIRMSVLALSELLGATVRDANGTARGHVREIAVAPQEHPTRIAYLIVKTSDGDRVLPASAVRSCAGTIRATTEVGRW